MNKVKDRPIIFAADSILALRKGIKNQTRRVMKYKMGDVLDFWINSDNTLFMHPTAGGTTLRKHACPYGNRGDRLWVKECWKVAPGGRTGAPSLYYKADGEGGENGHDPWFLNHGWKSPIFMPHGYSRFLLEIEKVGIEHVQDITEEDAIAEGVTASVCPPYDHIAHKAAYMTLWDDLNQKRGYGWKTNCLVWVIHFHIIKV